ncbi:protein IQ-DOMAIN 1-like isoform X2 [Ananas comosus]|uniref:Protein IQ-DOMAIN 1-like isoform X2 n=1 Tax=Ananas comosus TaxID=4615 RepID=A0A6P5GZ28_ANACO|nr:protein IQ-DOMAIN 1-like isoform X2 [Ananas comosus]
MGRKGKWFNALKKVFTHDSAKKQFKRSKSKKKLKIGHSHQPDPGPSNSNEGNNIPDVVAPPPPPPLPAEEVKEVKLMELKNEEDKHAYSVALASAVAAEAAAVAAQAAAEVVRLTATTRVPGKSRDEIAAIKIQTAFRGYMARRALRALRGLVRLKSLVDGNAAKRQTANTLRSMQTLARVQSQIQSRRIRMSEENHALQKQLQLKRERELEKLKMGQEWDDSLQSKEQMEASLLSRQEAAIRRERALAYAFSHQWKASSRATTPMFTDPNNPRWGWSWLERWMAARPWEGQTMVTNNEATDNASVKSATKKAVPREAISYQAAPSTPPKTSRPPSRRSPSTPPAKPPLFVANIKQSSPRGTRAPSEDDSRSIASLHSDRPRRHSPAGSSIRDDESLMSSPATRGYMQSTESARARSRLHSPSSEKAKTPEKGLAGSVIKRLSFPAVVEKPGTASQGRARRLSGPPKVDVASL